MSRLPRAVALASLLAFVLATRVFVAFDGIRVRMTSDPMVSAGGIARALTPSASPANDLRPPFAVIVRIHNDTAVAQPFEIQLDHQSVCRVTIGPTRASRADCAMRGEWRDLPAHELAVSGPATAWTLEYAEIATHHGRSNGMFDLRVIPPGSTVAVRPTPLWIAIGWLLMVLVGMLPPVALPRWARLTHRGLIILLTALMGIAVISPWVSPYLVVIAAAAYWKWLTILGARRLWTGILRFGWHGLRRLRRTLFQSAADPVVMPGSGQPLRLAWAALGLCLFGAVLLHVQLAHMHSVPDLGDPLFSIWRMAWVFHQLQGDPRPLFDANIFYPEHLTLTLSDSMLLPSLTAVPLLAARVHPVVVYNVLFLSGFLLSALAVYVLVARLTRSLQAAFIAALLFGFYPYRFEHYSHLELQMTEWMPLALLALHYFCTTQRARYAVAAVLCMIANLYSSMYYGVYFVLYTIAFTAALVIALRIPVRKLWRPLLLAGALGMVLAVPLARPYLKAQPLKGDRDVEEVEFYSAEVSDYLRAHARSAVYGEQLPSRHPERALFPGVMTLLLAACGLALPLGPTRLAYAAGLLFAFDASLGFHGGTYPLLYEFFSPIRGMRVAARFSIIVGMTLTVLAGFGVKRLLDRWAAATRQVVFAVLIAAIAVDLWPILELEHVWNQPPAMYAALARSPRAVLAEFPMHWHSSPDEDIPFMYFSVWHWTSMVNGYSGFLPASYERLVARLEHFPEGDSIDALAARGVTHVSVNCAFFNTVEGCEYLIDLLDNSPRFHSELTTRWEGHTVKLYKLLR